MFKHFLLLLTFLMMISCASEKKRSGKESEADVLTSLLEESPDSVYALLQAIEHPEALPPEKYYEYVLLRIRAKAKCDIDISADSAIFRAKDYFVRTGNDLKASYAGFYCGRYLRKMNAYEQALAYLQEAEEIAGRTKDSRLKGVIAFNIGAVLSEIPDRNEESLSHFFESSDFFLDSGKEYAEQLRDENRCLYYRQVFLWILGVGFVVAIMLLVRLLRDRTIRNREQTIKAENTIRELQLMAKSYNEMECSFRTTLLQHFNILKKVASLEIYISKEGVKRDQHLLKVVNEIVYGQDRLNWELLYASMNHLYHGFFDRLHTLFPSLDELEFRICCLTYARLTDMEIGLILKMSQKTVRMKRSDIRKKIGVPPFGHLNEFFDGILAYL